MKINKLDKSSLLSEITCFSHNDNRGSFVKCFHCPTFFDHFNQAFIFSEIFFSHSLPGVLRGFHLQVNQSSGFRLVSCVQGSILDVVIDLRFDLPSYGTIYSLALSSERNNALLIPPGFGHSFLNHSDSTATVLYASTAPHNAANDTGVLYSSVPFIWPISDPIISPRDLALPTLALYKSNAFTY